MSIRDEISKYQSYQMFCTPGHKGSLMKEDITEIDTAFPASCIADAERQVAGIIGAAHLRFLTAGSSVGVKAALMGFGDLLIQKNSHRSVIDAAELSKTRVFYIENDCHKGLELPPSKKQVLTALKQNPSVSTVVLTSPDYYGLAAGEEVARAVIKEGKRLHIDAAHGAHMFFRPDLFDVGIFKYAHSFNLSAHKTLPAYTGTAYLCVNDGFGGGDIAQIDHNLGLLGTTSPFYPFMAGLEEAALFTQKEKGRYDELLQAIKRLKKQVKCAKNDDFTRIVVDANSLKLSGGEVYARLKQRGIIAEKFDDRYIIFIVTVCDSAENVDKLAEELCRIRDCL